MEILFAVHVLKKRHQKENVIDGENDHTKRLNNLAVQEWEKTIELDDSIPGAHYILGTHYYNIGRLEAAEDELKRVIELNPE